MTKNETHSGRAANLRKRAEEEAGANRAQTQGTLSPEAAQHLLHELQVHQIELEMQNEELRRSQTELDASRARYFDLYDFAPVSYFTLSEQGLILEANSTAATLLGVSRSALVRRQLGKFIVPEDEDVYYRQRKRLLETGEPQVCELRMVRKNGAPLWVRLDATAAVAGEGEINTSACRVTMNDITERKSIEQELDRHRHQLEELVERRTRELEATREQARRSEWLASLGTFAAGIAHEINNPLAAILLTARHGLKVLSKPRELKTVLQEIAEDGERCAQIVSRVLWFARQEPSEKTPVSLAEVLPKACAQVEKYTLDRRARLVLQVPDDLPKVNADAAELEQVFVNLLTNAIHAGGTQKDVSVRAESVGETVRIRVQDHGCGMSDEIRAHAFDPFYTTRVREGGTGLGLSVAHGIITNHGGGIHIESSEGRGTTVTVELPCAVELSK